MGLPCCLQDRLGNHSSGQLPFSPPEPGPDKPLGAFGLSGVKQDSSHLLTYDGVGGGTGMLASHNCFVLRPPSHWHPEPKSSLFKDTTRTGIPADLENPHQDKETGVKGHSRRRHRESSTGDWG